MKIKLLQTIFTDLPATCPNCGGSDYRGKAKFGESMEESTFYIVCGACGRVLTFTPYQPYSTVDIDRQVMRQVFIIRYLDDTQGIKLLVELPYPDREEQPSC